MELWHFQRRLTSLLLRWAAASIGVGLTVGRGGDALRRGVGGEGGPPAGPTLGPRPRRGPGYGLRSGWAATPSVAAPLGRSPTRRRRGPPRAWPIAAGGRVDGHPETPSAGPLSVGASDAAGSSGTAASAEGAPG